MTGWGALSGGLSASGRWSQNEWEHRINCLELLAFFHVLQGFVSDSGSIHVRLAIDNSTAVADINNMGAQDPLCWILCPELYGSNVSLGHFN